jgi:hypothetical protein
MKSLVVSSTILIGILLLSSTSEKERFIKVIPAGFGQSNSQIEKDPGGYSLVKNCN